MHVPPDSGFTEMYQVLQESLLNRLKSRYCFHRWDLVGGEGHYLHRGERFLNGIGLLRRGPIDCTNTPFPVRYAIYTYSVCLTGRGADQLADCSECTGAVLVRLSQSES